MKRKHLALNLLLTALMMTGCGGKSADPTTPDIPDAPDDPVYPEEKYDVVFKDGDTIIKEYKDQLVGTYVDIPTLEEKERYTNTGWYGISDKAFKDGKVRVYEADDQTYTAIWDEMFGTENVYSATSLTSIQTISVDGDKDDAYDDAEEITVASGNATATAKAYVTYDVSNLYVFVEVTDSTNFPHKTSNQHANSCDSVGLYLDLMHDDKLAERGYTTGWGKAYRGEPGPMVEGMFLTSRGFTATTDKRYSDAEGSTFDWRGWLSNTAKDSGNTVATTKETSNGYNVEYRIELTNINIPDEYKPKAGNQFGLGIILYDQTSDSYDTTTFCSSKNGIETLNLESELGPKKLSNFVYKQNEHEDKLAVSATEIRDCFKVSNDNVRDDLYKDASVNTIEDDKIEILYDDDGYYFYVTKGSNVSSLTFKFNNSSTEVVVDANKKFSVGAADNNFTLSYLKDGAQVSQEYFIKKASNGNNLEPARQLFSAKRLDNQTITVDGELDAAYDQSVAIQVNKQSLVEKGTVNATGVAYIMYDASALYVFVDVTDDDVDTTTINNNNPEQNDCVELWLSTTQVLPTSSTSWGTDNRPDSGYCGEGMFNLRAGSASMTKGFHWLYDKTEVVKEATSKVTSTGYTAEFKIGWGSFDTTNMDNQIIDFSINISDGENNTKGTWNRHGLVATNYLCHNAYLKPYYLEHLLLAGK